MFIISAVQHFKIGDLSGIHPSNDALGDEMYDTQLPDRSQDMGSLTLDDERALARDSTAGFAGSYHSNVIPYNDYRLKISFRLGRLFVPKSACTLREPS
jgi:hypothetical protein